MSPIPVSAEQGWAKGWVGVTFHIRQRQGKEAGRATDLRNLFTCNKQSVSPPIPHLHALLTSGDDPPEEVDIFDLLKVSYEVSTHQGYLARLFHWAMWVQLAMVGGWPLLCGST